MFLEVYPQVLGVSTHKQCSKCGEYKPLDDFHCDLKGRGGKSARCANCACAHVKEWNAANKQRKAETGRAYRAQLGDERRRQQREWYAKHKEVKRLYYINNREKLVKYSRQWRLDNYERHLKSVRTYKMARPAEYANHARARRAREANASGSHSPEDITSIQKAQTDRRGRVHCWWCGKAIEVWHIDHKIPLTRGGGNGPDNLCLSCPKCNLSKHAKLPSEFAGRLL